MDLIPGSASVGVGERNLRERGMSRGKGRCMERQLTGGALLLCSPCSLSHSSPASASPSPSPLPKHSSTNSNSQHHGGSSTTLDCQSTDSSPNATYLGAREYSERAIENYRMANGTTIEDQIRVVDKIIKECDHSRKSLEQISRRLDDLQDEVKRYRDFLGHEKSRRDPALYKTTNNCERPSVYNDNICGTMSSLTIQLSQEWTEKLRSIHEIIHKVSASPPNSTGGSRASGQM